MFFDIHAHAYKYPYPISRKNGEYRFIFPTPEQLMSIHDAAGIERAVLLPLVSSEVYVPQSTDEIIEICNCSNGRFIPFCNVDPRVLTNTSDAPIGILLEYYKNLGCQGLGEVLPNLEFADLKMQNLFYHCQNVGFPLLFDITGTSGYGYGIYDEKGLPQLDSMLTKFNRLIFIGHGPAFWAEIAKIKQGEDRRGYPNSKVEEEGIVPKLMRNHKNLWVDLSAGSGSNAMLRDTEHAIHFLNEFWDRIMFGTDICFNEKYSYGIIEFLNALLAENKLSLEKYNAIAYKNAEKLLGSVNVI